MHDLKKNLDIIPMATKSVLEDPRTLVCNHCSRCILMGKVFYRKPMTDMQLKKYIDRIKELLNEPVDK